MYIVKKEKKRKKKQNRKTGKAGKKIKKKIKIHLNIPKETVYMYVSQQI